MARRNDPCPCGSGKKYKLCHGRGTLDAQSSGRVTTLPSKAQLFRMVATVPVITTIFTVQVWKPTFEDGEILREAGFKPEDSGMEDLENTMVFNTVDPEAAFRIATPEQWDAAPSFELDTPSMVIEKPEGMSDDEFAVWADEEIDRRMAGGDD
jgi:SEC-C motif